MRFPSELRVEQNARKFELVYNFDGVGVGVKSK